MASIFTTTDLENIKSALIEAALRGYSSVSVAGERHDNASLEELQNLFKFVQADMAEDTTATSPNAGLRIRQLVPGGTG